MSTEKLTERILNKGKSINGSWSHKQNRCFRVEVENNSGWKKQIIGKNYQVETINRFLELKDKHLIQKSSKAKKQEKNRNKLKRDFKQNTF